MKPEVAAQLKALNVDPYLLLITPAVTLPLVISAALLRFYVRGRMMRAFALDDWMLLIAVLSQIADSALYITASDKQIDQGLFAVENLLARIIIAGECMYLVGQVFLKASLGLYFYRVVNKKWQKLTIQILLGGYELYTFAYIGCAIFAYGLPTAHNILLQSNAPHAMNRERFKYLNYTYAILNIIVDVVFTAIPVMVVYSAMMPVRAKASVSVLILLGAVGSVVSIARIYYLPAISGNFTFKGISMLGVISLAETAAGSVAISLAATRPLFKACMERGKTFKGSNPSKSNNDYQTGISKRTEFTINERATATPEEDLLEGKEGISNVHILEV